MELLLHLWKVSLKAGAQGTTYQQCRLGPKNKLIHASYVDTNSKYSKLLKNNNEVRSSSRDPKLTEAELSEAQEVPPSVRPKPRSSKCDLRSRNIFSIEH